MNEPLVRELIEKALLRKLTFSEIIATLAKEGIESYHVDFLRNECRCYARNGESFVTGVAFDHAGVASDFSIEALEAINKRVQSGLASYPDFVREGAAAGCAYYVVYVNGKKVRYFARDGGEHIQNVPGSW
jgi:uncharacterized protein YbcV (DUF1398 family)